MDASPAALRVKPRVYVETTIPSFYFEIRKEPEMIARREWTRRWWDDERHHYDLVTSIPVLEELQRGNHPYRQATSTSCLTSLSYPWRKRSTRSSRPTWLGKSCQRTLVEMPCIWHWRLFTVVASC